MIRLPARAILVVVSAVHLSGCLSVSHPVVDTVAGAAISGYDAVHFQFGDSWATHHTMTEVLQQEFERRGFVVLLEEPPESVRDRMLELHLAVARDAKTAGEGRADHLRHLDFTLRRPADGSEVGRARYDGRPLDRIEQRELGKTIVDRLLEGQGSAG